jgi:hypothetical protein
MPGGRAGHVMKREVSAPTDGGRSQQALEVGRVQDATGHAPMAPGSDREALATLGAARIDHGAPPTGLHADEEPVRTGAANLRRLICALHGAQILGLCAGDASHGPNRGDVPHTAPAGIDGDGATTAYAFRRDRCQMLQSRWRPENRALEQKGRFGSNTCTAAPASGQGLTAGRELWITASFAIAPAYTLAAPTRTSPQ